jgi:hypothetical protein
MCYISSSGSLTQIPIIQRFNASTGAYIGTASFSTSSCGGSSATYYMYDADVYNGKVYTAHYSYYEVNRWNVSITNAATNPPTVMWTCEASFNYNSPNYITGVDFDDATGKMYIGVYDM